MKIRRIESKLKLKNPENEKKGFLLKKKNFFGNS